MNQTLQLTSLGPLQPGDRVNLELALRAGDRLGGHFVQGHVDGTAEVIEAEEDGFARRLRVQLDPELAGQVVEQGRSRSTASASRFRRSATTGWRSR